MGSNVNLAVNYDKTISTAKKMNEGNTKLKEKMAQIDNNIAALKSSTSASFIDDFADKIANVKADVGKIVENINVLEAKLTATAEQIRTGSNTYISNK